MPKKERMMKNKEECSTSWVSWLILLAGVFYALQDLGMGLNFWKFQWYTVAFVLWGLCALAEKK